MRWGVLGPLLVTDKAGKNIRVPAGRLQTLLAVLLMRANQLVPLDEIVELVWDGASPPPRRGRSGSTWHGCGRFWARTREHGS